jgi:hypothetical protein
MRVELPAHAWPRVTLYKKSRPVSSHQGATANPQVPHTVLGGDGAAKLVTSGHKPPSAKGRASCTQQAPYVTVCRSHGCKAVLQNCSDDSVPSQQCGITTHDATCCETEAAAASQTCTHANIKLSLSSRAAHRWQGKALRNRTPHKTSHPQLGRTPHPLPGRTLLLHQDKAACSDFQCCTSVVVLSSRTSKSATGAVS